MSTGGCVDLFADAIKWWAMLVRVWCHNALGVVSVVDWGCVNLSTDAVKRGAMLVRVCCRNALGAVSVVDHG